MKASKGARVPRVVGILVFFMCVLCYQAAWERSKTFDPPISLEQAFKLLSEKGLPKVPKYEKVPCSMPWCQKQIPGCPDNKVTDCTLAMEGIYVCGRCRAYLKNTVVSRFQHTGKDWLHWTVEAIKGRVIAPKTAEHCSLPWCKAKIVPTKYGPQGQPICRTDEVRLRLYARRNNISFEQAFFAAPPPRWGIERRVGIFTNISS